MKKVGNEGVITVEEAKSLETELDVVEGMHLNQHLTLSQNHLGYLLQCCTSPLAG